jgi:hypothetical protein
VSTSIKEIWECTDDYGPLNKGIPENVQVVSGIEWITLSLSYMLTFNPKMYEASESGLDQVIWVNVSYRLTAVCRRSSWKRGTLLSVTYHSLGTLNKGSSSSGKLCGLIVYGITLQLATRRYVSISESFKYYCFSMTVFTNVSIKESNDSFFDDENKWGRVSRSLWESKRWRPWIRVHAATVLQDSTPIIGWY